MTSSRSIRFDRERARGGEYCICIATTKTEDPAAPVELIRPFGDGSGNEVLVSLTKSEWLELVAFVGEHIKDEGHPERWVDIDRLDAIKWGDKIIDPAEVVYVLREAK